MAKLKAYVERIKNQFRNKELLPKKVWMLLSKSFIGFFMKFFSQSRHFFILDLGKGSDQDLYNLHNYDNPSDYAKNQQVKTSKKIAEGYDKSWCSEETISLISSYLVGRRGENAFRGICHGTRV